MMLLLWGVFVASLVGSLHCAGMCGPLVAFCSAGRGHGALSLGAYHGARLVGYLLLGAVAGGFGAAIDLGGEAAGLGHMAAVLGGSVMVLGGLGTYFAPGLSSWRARRGRGPGPVTRVVTRLTARARTFGATKRSLAIGGLTAFLPCGWLYAFAAAAAGTGAPWGGALVMAAFWAGTVPILFALGLGVGGLLGPLQRRAPLLISTSLVALGLFTLFGRWSVPSFAESLGPGVGGRALAGELAGEELPCCTGTSAPTETGLEPLAEPCGCTHPGPCVAGETCGCPGCGKAAADLDTHAGP
ncbi:MAG: sulfite exporter TauE/SafE family protein [Planctomycetota bacterium]|nr:sulfite exporter TauE/SafE family protein [Planctomycetota bacterium]